MSGHWDTLITAKYLYRRFPFILSVDHVDERIDAFLTFFGEELANLSEKGFATLQETMVSMKSTHDESLHEEASRNWEEIGAMERLFDRNQIQVTTPPCL